METFYIAFVNGCNKTIPQLLFIGNSFNKIVNEINDKYNIDILKYDQRNGTADYNSDGDNDSDGDKNYDKFLSPFEGKLDYVNGYEFIVPKKDLKKCEKMFPQAFNCTCYCNIYIFEFEKDKDEIIDLKNILDSIESW